MTPPSAIWIQEVRMSFGDQTVLSGLNLDVQPGHVHALLGRNGAGKTTLINIMSTLLRPSSGTVVIAGHDILTDPESVRAAISCTGQFASLDPVLTGRENLEFLGRLRGLSRRELTARASELLDGFDLVAAADRRVSSYSGGMRRRLDLALSLVVTPEILFLDEPTTGLDLAARHTLWDLIGGLATDGVTVLLTTQYLEEADALADHVSIIDEGVIVADGTPNELKRRVGGEVLDVTSADGELLASIPTDGTIAHIESVVASMDAHARRSSRIAVRTPTLDDVFRELTASKNSTDTHRRAA